MPVIRQLCNKMGAFAAPHHIFAGVSSILVFEEQRSAVKLQALIVAIYILVTTRLAGTETAPNTYQKRRDLALEIVKNASMKYEADVEVSNADIDDCMREIKDQKWTQMDWFRNITQGAGVGLVLGGEDEVEDGSGSDEVDDEGVLPMAMRTRGSEDILEQSFLQAGLGTMVKTSFSSLRYHSLANLSKDARSGRLPWGSKETRVPSVEERRLDSA